MSDSIPSVTSLLSNLKSIVELVIRFPGDFLTSQYGAMQRLRSAILAILLHGLKRSSTDIYAPCWRLILALNDHSQKHIQLLQDVYQKEDVQTSIEQWIDQSVLRQCLVEQLSSAPNLIDVLEQSYLSSAFMRISSFYQAFLICIRAIESGEPSFLMDIDPKLSMAGFECPAPVDEVMHRSNSSVLPIRVNSIRQSASIIDSDDHLTRPGEHGHPRDPMVTFRVLHRRNQSDPIFRLDETDDVRARFSTQFTSDGQRWNFLTSTDSCLPLEQSMSVDEHPLSISSRNTLMDADEQSILGDFNPLIESEMSENVTTKVGHLPNSSLSWPRKDQTLENYLREHDSQTRTDMEKENAHFYLSEAILSAIEYVKFRQPSSISSVPSKYPESSKDMSAESIALTLVERWKACTLPTAQEVFETLLTDEDVIEEFPVQSESSPDAIAQPAQRGNDDWAPPREQLIFHIHGSSNREKQLKKQGYRCAGCGRRVEKGYSDRYRYCEYTDKYFCHNCHSEKKFFLPSYIINNWDFSNKHSVSNFAFNYLTRLFSEPTFDIQHLNSKLFQKSRKLKAVNELRWSLCYLEKYIFTCNMAEESGLQGCLRSLPAHLYQQPHTYSLEDLVQTKSGEFYKRLEPLVNSFREHVLTCSLCYGKGFICELCQNEKEILFPFNTKSTSVCPVCRSCFHTRCHQNQKDACPKCQRTKQRKLSSRKSLPT